MLRHFDAQLRGQTRSEILRLQQLLGITTIYVTHDQVEAMTMGERIAVISNGVLQQVGTPSELYNDPLNVFVAAFMGTPGMNFASAKVRDGSVEVSGRTFRLTGRERHAAAQGADREVLIGFRPEDLQLDGEGHSGEIRISARIEAVEYLGREELLRGRAIGERIVALVPSGTNVRVGDDVHFAARVWDDVTAETAGPSSGASIPAHSIQRLVMGDAIDEIIRAGHRNRAEGRLVSVQAVFDRP